MRHLPRLRSAVSASLCCSSSTPIRTTAMAAVATTCSSTNTQSLQRRTLSTSVIGPGTVETQTPPQGLKPPSKGWQVAVRPDKITDPAYVPAQDGLELEEVGGLDGWWENPANYGVGKEWVRFGPAEKITDPAILEVAVYRALVEALALRREMKDTVAGDIVLSSGWGPMTLTTTAAKTKLIAGQQGNLFFVDKRGHEAMVAALEEYTLGNQDTTLTAESEVKLEPEAKEEVETAATAEQTSEAKGEIETAVAAEQEPEVKEEVETPVAAEQEPEVKEQVETAVATDDVPTAEMAQAILEELGYEWKRATIKDLALKFFAAKRIQRLTGHKIPDGKLVAIGTPDRLLKELIKPPRAKKLAEEIEAKEIFQSLPNVRVFPRRVTPIDKEKMVGRWKVIREELERRGLPAIGTANIDNAIEKKWVTGMK